MKNRIPPILSLLAALALSSCFQNETTIRLNKDGSGSLTEEKRVGAQVLSMMSLGEDPDGAGAPRKNPLDEMLSEEKGKARAAELGEGVTLVKIEPVTVGTFKGARATYRFTDINKLRISLGEGMEGGTKSSLEEEEPAADKSKPIGFNYKNGVLTLRTNIEKQADKPEASQKPVEGSQDFSVGADDPEEGEQDPAAEAAMMKMMCTDMKFSLKLVVDSGISESDASYRDGNTITLAEMDMNKLMQDPENLKKLTATNQQDRAAAMESLKGIDGVKIELKPEVTVKLK